MNLVGICKTPTFNRVVCKNHFKILSKIDGVVSHEYNFYV